MGISYFNSKKYPRGIRLLVVVIFLGLITVQFSSEFHRSANLFWRLGTANVAKNVDIPGKTHGLTAVSKCRLMHSPILDKRYDVSAGFLIPAPPGKIERPCFYISRSVALLPLSYTSHHYTTAALRGPPAVYA